MTEADEFIKQVNSDSVKDLKKYHRRGVEKHAQRLEKIKSEIHEKLENKETFEISSSANGMHEAILDIMKSMRNFKKMLF